MINLKDILQIEWKKLYEAKISVLTLITLIIIITWGISNAFYVDRFEGQEQRIKYLEKKEADCSKTTKISAWDISPLSTEELSSIRHLLIKLPTQRVVLFTEEHSKDLADTFADLFGPENLNWKVRFDRDMDGPTTGLVIYYSTKTKIIEDIINAIEDGTRGRLRVRFEASNADDTIRIAIGSKPH